jgi:hypothetical protein
MLDYIENPRRAARVMARCLAAVTAARRTFDAETEDVGAAGCRLSSPRFVHRGEPILLRLYAHGLSDGLRVPARIAWTTDVSPWRLGVAFDADARRTTDAWFARLVQSSPGLRPQPRVPDRIALRSMVWLGPPPRLIVDLSEDQLELVRAIGEGTTLKALHERFHDRWTTLQPTFFSLLAHRRATLQRGASVHPAAWKHVIGEAPRRATFAPPMLGADAWGRRNDAIPSFGGRSPEAEALYARALERLARNQPNVAQTLLRQAARVAPGDPGIAAALARATSRSS